MITAELGTSIGVGRAAAWSHSDQGRGTPLVLLHGIGMSRAAWNPVTPYLRDRRRVIAFDIAGFGSTPPLPDGVPPTIPNLVDGLYRSLHELALPIPTDIAGNSLGGWIALEAAKRGIARSVAAISPPGLWNDGPPAHVRYVFRSLRFTATAFPELLRELVRASWMRELAFAIPISTGSRRMPHADALRAIDDLANSRAFEETFEHTQTPFSGTDIRVPLTVAFGARDWVLTRRARVRDRLPVHTRWVEPPGWGHVPMWTDPVGVSRLILGDSD